MEVVYQNQKGFNVSYFAIIQYFYFNHSFRTFQRHFPGKITEIQGITSETENK